MNAAEVTLQGHMFSERTLELTNIQTLNVSHTAIAKVELSTDKELISCKLFFREETDPRKLETQAMAAFDSICDRIAQSCGIIIKDLKIVSCFISRGGAPQRIELADNFSIIDSVSFTIKPTAEGCEKFVHSLSLDTLTTKDLYTRLYRKAMTTEDPVGRFLSLFHIIILLSQATKDEQRIIDNYIKEKQPAVPIITSEYDKNGQRKTRTESIYLNLRNRLLHTRAGTGVNLVQISEEMKQNVASLAGLVFKVLTEMA